jgi:hypothetical protein
VDQAVVCGREIGRRDSLPLLRREDRGARLIGQFLPWIVMMPRPGMDVESAWPGPS